MARILIVTSEYEPFSSSGINRISFFKKHMERQGHFVAVLSTTTAAQGLKSDKSYDIDNNIYRAFTLSLLMRRLLSSRRLPIYQKLSTYGKYDLWRIFAVNKGDKLVKELKIDYVFSSFPDFISVAVAQKISKNNNLKLITDFRDPPFAIFKRMKSEIKLKRCMAVIAKVIADSVHIITCTDSSLNLLKDNFHTSANSVVIENGYDHNIICQIPDKLSKEKEYFEIVHIGTFYENGRDIKRVLNALLLIINEADCKIKLRLIGDAIDPEVVRFYKNKSDKIELSIEPPLPMLDALSIAKEADALLLLQGSRFDKQIPTKVYEYLALNRPIWALVGIDGATHNLLKKNIKNVVISDYDDINSLSHDLLSVLKLDAVTVPSNHLSRQSQVNKLDHIFV